MNGKLGADFKIRQCRNEIPQAANRVVGAVQCGFLSVGSVFEAELLLGWLCCWTDKSPPPDIAVLVTDDFRRQSRLRAVATVPLALHPPHSANRHDLGCGGGWAIAYLVSKS